PGVAPTPSVTPRGSPSPVGGTRGCPRRHRCRSPAAPAPPRSGAAFGADADAEALLDSLGLGSGARNAPGTPGWGQGQRDPPGAARAGIREPPGGGSAGRIPGKTEFRPDPEQREQPAGPGGGRDEPDFSFGSYEPSVASGSSRRQGRGFPAGSSSRRPSGAAWLGLKDEDLPG
ncbi:FBF1 factor, partial [Dasyornis broadbenti]|nr:FBF1 factor [Dasyornis broadbenti]